ncbi:dephospho-CoA kinase [Synechococcus sp. AH-551-N17]|nr:dephospho-CoA kinase [Synechococcus sp. AH-551-N17]
MSAKQRWEGPQRRIGLTGGIASGKSSVGKYLTTLGLPVLDADVYSRRALAHGTKAAEAVLQRYGSLVKQPLDSINRSALGQIVFNDPKERLWLEQLIHPIVLNSFEEEIAQQPKTTALVLMIPLLFEASLQTMCSEIWVVHCDPAQQLQRLCRRDGLDESTALTRIKSQWPLSEKCQSADLVLDNSSDHAVWKKQITSHLD